MPALVLPTPWNDVLREAVGAVPGARDPEPLHRMRVCARRLDVWLRLARRAALRDDLRWLRRSSSEARDLDVLAEQALPEPLSSWLLERRAEAHARLQAVLFAGRTEALLVAVRHLAPAPRDVALDEAVRLARRALRRGRRLERAPEDEQRLHALRRAVRATRFAGEWLELDASAWHALQDRLGLLRDRLVLLRWIARHPDPHVLEPLEREVTSELHAERAAVLAEWRADRPALTQEVRRWSSG